MATEDLKNRRPAAFGFSAGKPKSLVQTLNPAHLPLSRLAWDFVEDFVAGGRLPVLFQSGKPA